MRSKRHLFGICHLVWGLIFLVCGFSFAVDTTSRLFFADAKISFIVPEHWAVNNRFPYGPLFIKTVQDGPPATVALAISDPLDENRLSSDIPPEVLKSLAKNQLATGQSGYTPLTETDKMLMGRHAFEITWQNAVDSVTWQNDSIYFFVDNRIYAVTLRSSPKSFKWLLADFDSWLETLRLLSKQNSGALDAPARGGIWLHQTAQLKVTVPDTWLIGVAHETLLGATSVQGQAHADFTVSVDISSPTPTAFVTAEKKDIRKAIRQKGFRILDEKELLFQERPAMQFHYEGPRGADRYIEGQDLWVLGPQGRVLFNVESDRAIYSSLADTFTAILKNVQWIHP